MNYRREIDGLRGIAVLTVILFHAKIAPFSGGYVGVDVFFVISGFLITSLLLREHIETNRISYFNFVARRARRILPALLCVIAVSALLSWYLMTPMQLRDFAQSAVATLLFASNILFYIESGYFAPVAELKPLLHTWSLAIEEQYYLVYPMLAAVLLKRSRKLLFYFTAGLAVICAFVGIATTAADPVAAFFLTPMRAAGILIGALVAISMSLNNTPVSRRYAEPAAALGFFMILVAVFALDEFSSYPGYKVLIPVIGTALLIRYIDEEHLLYKFLSHKYLVALGLISFSLYLWHQPVLVFTRMFTLDHLSATSTLVGLIITFLLSLLSWKYVEQPFRNRRIIKTPLFTSSMVIVSVVFLAVSLFTIQSRGELKRYSSETLTDLTNLRMENSARQNSIQADICQYNNRTGIGLDGFIAQYDCVTPVANSTQPKILVAGDSHAADLAVAFRENDIPITQLTAAGCSLDPANMSDDCRRIFDTLLPQTSRELKPDVLIISNRYEGNELGAEAGLRTWDYWSEHAKAVMIFTEAVELPSFDRSIAIGKTLTAKNYSPPYMDSRNDYFNTLESAGAIIVNRKKIFCELTENCIYRDVNGELLMVDPDHLSTLGAREFGSQLLELYPELSTQ